MHFLNGGRIFIKPEKHVKTLEQQLAGCLMQLGKIALKKRIYKVNFFAATHHEEDYFRLKELIKEKVCSIIPAPFLYNLIAQSPDTCNILAEVFYYNRTLWPTELYRAENGSAITFEREGARALVGQVQVTGPYECSISALTAFRSMGELLDKTGFRLNTLTRQWNYIENILGIDGAGQRYQQFNNVRSAFYGNHFNDSGYPAATAIGVRHGGILLEFVAIDAPFAINLPLNNPVQVAAHAYSPEVLAGHYNLPGSTPKFERARFLELFGQKQLFISGTASITGEKTAGAGDPEAQTRITIENIRRLYSKENILPVAGNQVQPHYGHARVYVKNREDFPVVKKTFKSFYGNLPVVYLQADICRECLLVEIEGKVILTKTRQKL